MNNIKFYIFFEFLNSKYRKKQMISQKIFNKIFLSFPRICYALSLPFIHVMFEIIFHFLLKNIKASLFFLIRRKKLH